VGGAIFQGGDSSSNGASVLAGYAILRGGFDSNAAPNAAAQEGATEVVEGYIKGAAVAAVGDLVSVSATNTVTDAAVGAVNVIGVATNIAQPISVVVNGTVPVQFDNTAVVGDIACGVTTTGKAHDNGNVPCPYGQVQVGVVVNVTGTNPITIASGTTTASATISTSLALVALSLGATINNGAITNCVSGADYTNSTVTPSTVWTFTLPATPAARSYRWWTSDVLWESTNTTLVGPVIGVSVSAAPTQLTANAWVQTALAGTDTTGYLSNNTTGSQTLITGAAAGVTTTNYRLAVWGTIEGAPAAGSTFLINAASTSGTTATLNIRRGSCATVQPIP
jgi:hypothetical protein